MVTPMSGLTGILLETRGVLAIGGPEARALLQGLVTNDMDKVSSTRAIYAALLTPQGKFLHDFLIAQVGDTLLFDCEGPRRADLLRRLMMYRLRAKAEIADASDDWAVAALMGEGSAAKLGLANDVGAGMPCEGGIAFVDPRLCDLGIRLILPKAKADAVLSKLADKHGTVEDYDAHRLSLGVPDGSRDIEVEKTFLLETNAEALHAIDFDKGCYVGQELTARTKRRANLKWRLYPVEVTGHPLPAAPVIADGKEIGALRTTAAGHGLAYLRIEDAESALAANTPLRAGDAELKIRTLDWMRA